MWSSKEASSLSSPSSDNPGSQGGQCLAPMTGSMDAWPGIQAGSFHKVILGGDFDEQLAICWVLGQGRCVRLLVQTSLFNRQGGPDIERKCVGQGWRGHGYSWVPNVTNYTSS